MAKKPRNDASRIFTLDTEVGKKFSKKLHDVLDMKKSRAKEVVRRAYEGDEAAQEQINAAVRGQVDWRREREELERRL